MEVIETIVVLFGLGTSIALTCTGVCLMIEKHQEKKYNKIHRCSNCRFCNEIAYDGYVTCSCKKNEIFKAPEYCSYWLGR